MTTPTRETALDLLIAAARGWEGASDEELQAAKDALEEIAVEEGDECNV